MGGVGVSVRDRIRVRVAFGSVSTRTMFWHGLDRLELRLREKIANQVWLQFENQKGTIIRLRLRVGLRPRGFMSNESVTEWHGTGHLGCTISLWTAGSKLLIGE